MTKTRATEPRPRNRVNEALIGSEEQPISRWRIKRWGEPRSRCDTIILWVPQGPTSLLGFWGRKAVARGGGPRLFLPTQRDAVPPGMGPRKTSPSQGALPAFEKLEVEVLRSREILSLPDDWDDAGSPPYRETTWQRAVAFLRAQALEHWNHQSRAMPIPRILPGPSGSIDVHWKSARSELLVNFPEDPSQPATFYGDDYGAASIKGALKESRCHLGLICWLSDLECPTGP